MILNRKPLIFTLLICIAAGTFSYSQETGTLTDSRDGNEYKTIKIGDQWWMGENLAYKTDEGCWILESIDGFAKTYGYLYSFEIAQKVCPEGWHLPSDAEFEALSYFLGGSEVAGGKLKETGTDHWNSPNAGATNSSGFTALSSGNTEYEAYLGIMTFFWSSDDTGDFGLSHALYSAKTEFSRYGLSMEIGASVRCIKD